MLNCLPLQLQIGQCISSNIFRFVRNSLTVSQALRTSTQSICSAEQLLALLELVVRAGVVRVAISKKSGTVGGEGFERAFVGVDVRFVVSKALIYFRAGGRGDVLLFEAHLIELWEKYGVSSLATA